MRFEYEMERLNYHRQCGAAGSLRLRDIATLLEACQYPSRFSELERKTGWYRDRLIRMLRFLISLDLVEVKLNEENKRVYEINEHGARVLKRLNNVLSEPERDEA
ncbi:MAG: hypothetical protein QW334_01580 [Thermofilum sp.]